MQRHPCTAGVRSHPLTAQLPPVHAAYRRAPASSAASSFRDSVPATLPHHLRFGCLHAPPPPRLAPCKPHHPLQPCAQTAPAHSMQHHPRTAGVRSHPLTAQLPPMHAAYYRGEAASAASSWRDSVPATLPQLLRSNFLHETPPPRLAHCKPHHPSAAPASHDIIHAQPAFAATRSQRSCRRCTQRTVKAQLRQLLHPGETRCQRRCPIISDLIAYTHRRPLGSPLAEPHHPLQPCAQTAPAHSMQRHLCTAGVRSHPLKSQLPPVHAAYYGASAPSAASSWRGSVPATLPQLLRSNFLHASPLLSSPLRKPHHPLQPCAITASARNTQHHPCTAGVRKHPLTVQLAADARSVPPRTSDVSCVILARLGASDAAPAA
jgi:mRNA-degrading endonuclease toxin of MazEF toxin-antitoxin module